MKIITKNKNMELLIFEVSEMIHTKTTLTEGDDKKLHKCLAKILAEYDIE